MPVDQLQVIGFCTFFLFLLYNTFQQQRLRMLSGAVQLRHMQTRLLNRELQRRYKRSQRRQQQQPRARVHWTLPRQSESWFDIHYYDHTRPEEFFKSKLRLGKRTFQMLLNDLIPKLTRQDTPFRRCIPPEKILALGLFRLAQGETYLTIGPDFNVGKSTVVEAVQDVVEALYELRDSYIKFPSTEEEISSTVDTFKKLSSLPNLAGAIDSIHIRLKRAPKGSSDYLSSYNQHDFVVQGVTNGMGLFMDVAPGFPGSMRDSNVLQNSTLYRRIEAGKVLSGPVVRVRGTDIRPYLVGGNTFPLAPWLQKPFQETESLEEKALYNGALSSARLSVKTAFKMLKSRWGVLRRRLDCRMEFVCKTVVACAVLHNLCILAGDNWVYDEQGEGLTEEGVEDNNNDIIGNGEVVRQALLDYISSSSLKANEH